MNVIPKFLEQQQGFHFNYGDSKENTNSYNTIASGTHEEMTNFIKICKKERDVKKVTLFEMKKIVFDATE